MHETRGIQRWAADTHWAMRRVSHLGITDEKQKASMSASRITGSFLYVGSGTKGFKYLKGYKNEKR